MPCLHPMRSPAGEAVSFQWRLLGEVAVIALAIAPLGTVACGRDDTSPTNPGDSVTVSVSPLSAAVAVLGTQQFVTVVGGTGNTGVRWSVNGVNAGNATVGGISTAGLYTAPAAIPTTGTVTIRVTSIADPRKSATATVSITAAFSIDINITRGTIRFPNRYSGWQVGGASATNFVAYPSGWTVGGAAGTNFVALAPGWTAGGAAQTNFIALAPGWSLGGASGTNFIPVPPGWTVGGGAASNFVPLPPGWTTGGGAATNFVPLAPGWTVGGGSATNFVTVPPGWTVGGGSATNFVAIAAGWTVGGGSATNFVALPPGWTVGGAAQTHYIAVAPNWIVGGSSVANFVAYPAASLTTLELRFEDPSYLGMLQVLQQSGLYSGESLADIAMVTYLNYGNRLWRPGP